MADTDIGQPSLYRRLFDSDSSSGSDHDAADPSFSSLLNGFFFHEDLCEDIEDIEDIDVSDPTSIDLSLSSMILPAAEMMRDMVKLPSGDRFAAVLLKEVTRIVERLGGARRAEERGVFLRKVMGSLRESGYDAGLCKARWGKSKGVTPGSYEYIDVVRSPPRGEKRYIIDVNFVAEFVIARPTQHYESALVELPEIYVGLPEDLKRLLTIMADAAKRSLTARDLHVPPWRKRNYMRAKWLGPYKRTTNLVGGAGVPAAEPTVVVVRVAKGSVVCRTVGFETQRHVDVPRARRVGEVS